MAQIIKLIYTQDRTGTGTEDDQVRLCPQLWTLQGTLIAQNDPCDPTHTFVDLDQIMMEEQP